LISLEPWVARPAPSRWRSAKNAAMASTPASATSFVQPNAEYIPAPQLHNEGVLFGIVHPPFFMSCTFDGIDSATTY